MHKKVTKVTTAVLLAGPKDIGPFSDESAWRIGLTCQVVDGGSNGPFMLCDMPGRTQHAIPWHDLGTESAVDAALFALCLYYGDGYILGMLEDTHNVVVEDNDLRLAPFYEFAPEVKARLFERMSGLVKLAVLDFGQESSLTHEALRELEANGLSITRFGALEN